MLGDAGEMLPLTKRIRGSGGKGERTPPRKELQAFSLNTVFDRQVSFKMIPYLCTFLQLSNVGFLSFCTQAELCVK